MSIAVSTVVQPSRLLANLIALVCLGSIVITALIGVGVVGNFPLFWRWIIALGFLVIPVLASYRTIWRKKSLHIDISYNGQIKVEEDKALATKPRKDCLLQQRDGGEVVKLMPDSTLWPYLLLLRLQAEDRKIRQVLILPDCMSARSFRALSVACRWIAAHNDHAER
jgi:toxin CptA